MGASHRLLFVKTQRTRRYFGKTYSRSYLFTIEKAGFFVDAIVGDGASPSRKVWELFGLDENEGKCPHPVSAGNENRKLYVPFF